MARIVISSLGTTGDFVPFVPLAKGLKQRGHTVLVAVNEAMHFLFQRAGFEVMPCGPRFGPEDARAAHIAFNGWEPYTGERQQLDARINDVPANFRDLQAACQGADLLITASIQYAAPLVRATLGVPWACVFCNAECLEHDPTAETNSALPQADLLLLASSSHFSRARADLYPQLHITGFWHYAGEDQPGWAEPSPELRAFVDGGSPPLVLLPGSIPVKDPRRVVAVHAEAAALLGLRLVIQEGWAQLAAHGLPSSLPAQAVFLARDLPHDWLLQRAAAVITHGTMGIVSKALRAGCPMLVEPYGRDLFFNAHRVVALGVGAAMNPHKLTAAGVGRVLTEKVLQPTTHQRARELGGRIGAEDGVDRACSLIEEELARHPPASQRMFAAPVSARRTVLVYNDMWKPSFRLEQLQGLPPGWEVTKDRKRLREADTVVFHLPKRTQLDLITKLPGPKWVAWSMECEQHYPQFQTPQMLSQFDLTMSYRRTADVVLAYPLGPNPEATLLAPPPPKNEAQVAVLFLSSSFDLSWRVDYASEMMRFLDVHSYGEVLNNRILVEDHGRATKLAILGRYKFNLAFENALAEDYVSEKFFDPLVAGCVPVYLGAPNIEEFAPGDHCFVNAADFPSARALAEYLLELNANDEAYAEYFAWKTRPLRQSFLRTLEERRVHPFVRLCRKLAEQR
jgi:UDP:flavonoid glycosyltransferase YjiC (YdhE family)